MSSFYIQKASIILFLLIQLIFVILSLIRAGQSSLLLNMFARLKYIKK